MSDLFSTDKIPASYMLKATGTNFCIHHDGKDIPLFSTDENGAIIFHANKVDIEFYKVFSEDGLDGATVLIHLRGLHNK